MHIKTPTESHLASAPSRGALCCGCWLWTCLVFVQDSWDAIDLRWFFYINFSITGFIHRKTKNNTCLRAKLCVWDSPRRYFCFRSSLGHIARFHPCPLSLWGPLLCFLWECTHHCLLHIMWRAQLLSLEWHCTDLSPVSLVWTVPSASGPSGDLHSWCLLISPPSFPLNLALQSAAHSLHTAF